MGIETMPNRFTAGYHSLVRKQVEPDLRVESPQEKAMRSEKRVVPFQ